MAGAIPVSNLGEIGVGAAPGLPGHVARGWTPLQIRTLVFAALILFFDGYDLLSISYAAPHIRDELGLGSGDLGRIFSAGLIGMIGGGLLVGPLADRFGMRGFTVASFLLAGVATFATAFAQTADQILLLRLIAGIGLGGAMPGAFAYAGDYSLAARRRTTLAIVGIAYGLGGAAAGLASSVLADIAGWHTIFLLGGGVTVVIALCALLWMPQSLSYLSQRGTVEQLQRLLQRLPRGLIAAAPMPMVPGAKRPPFPVRLLFADGWWRLTIGLWLASFLLLAAWFLMVNWIPTVVAAGGGDAQSGGRALMLIQLGQAAGGLAVGIAMDRIRSPFLMAFVATATAVAAFAASAVTGLPIVFASCCLVLGFFHAASQGSVSYTATLVYPAAARMTGIAWLLSIGRTGAVISPLVGSILLARRADLSTFFIVASGAAMVAAIILFATGMAAKGRIGG